MRLRVENAALATARSPGEAVMRDLLVAGGGPVGLATALYAARAGLDVRSASHAAGRSTRPAARG